MKCKRLIWLVILLLASWGCQADKGKTEQTEIRISAASSLSRSLSRIEEEFTKVNTDVKITINYGGSGTLRKQIEHGVQIDLIFLASEKDYNLLKETGRIEKGTTLFENRLAVIGAKDSDVESLEDFLSTDGKLAIGTPEAVPAGTYAVEALKNIGYYDDLSGRIVYTKDVQQVKTMVKEGAVPIGIVYLSDTVDDHEVKVVEEVEVHLHSPIFYFVGQVNQKKPNAKRKKEIESFYNFVLGKTSKDIFKEYGFIPVNGE